VQDQNWFKLELDQWVVGGWVGGCAAGRQIKLVVVVVVVGGGGGGGGVLQPARVLL